MRKEKCLQQHKFSRFSNSFSAANVLFSLYVRDITIFFRIKCDEFSWTDEYGKLFYVLLIRKILNEKSEWEKKTLLLEKDNDDEMKLLSGRQKIFLMIIAVLRTN